VEYGNSQQNPSAIVSLTIFDTGSLDPHEKRNLNSRVLVGVRRPETNKSAPNVVSVPTQRVPFSTLNQICQRTNKVDIQPSLRVTFPQELSEVYFVDGPEVDSTMTSGHDPVVYIVEAILATKLGLAEHLELGHVSFVASPMTLIVGTVLHEKQSYVLHGQPVKIEEREYYQEYQRMCNINVNLHGAECVPQETASYSQLKWIDVDELCQIVMTKGKRHLLSIFGEHAVSYRIHGMCLLSTYISLSRELSEQFGR